MTCMYAEAVELIKQKAKDLKLDQVELATKANISPSQISRIFSFKSTASSENLANLAVAVRLPPDHILEIAGVLPHGPSQDGTLKKITHLYHTLKEPTNKKRALEFLEFLSEQEEKNDRKGKGS